MSDQRLDSLGVLTAVRGLGAGLDDVVVIGGAAMAMYGLRLAHDVDFLASRSLWDRLDSNGWTVKYWNPPTGQVKALRSPDGRMEAYRDATVPGVPCTFEMVLPQATFMLGVRCEPLELLRRWKRAYGRTKDMADADLIDRWLQS